MILESFRITGAAVAQIFVLGALGYFLVKRNILGDCGLESLSRLTLDVTLPLLIFAQLVSDFSFSLYPHWWIFPLLSIAVTLLGLLLGGCASAFIKGRQQKLQFITLVAFQNSGYLPLTLIAALLPEAQRTEVFIYLFLFLLGFNLVMFSLGVYMLASTGAQKFEAKSLLNPPVAATLISFAVVLLGLGKLIPGFVMEPVRMIGETTLPLALLVVGGNLAQIHLHKVHKAAMGLMIPLKLIIMPLAGLLLVMKFNVPPLVGLLLLIQLAVPPATTPSVIVRHYRKNDILISQGIFFGHLASIVTLPLFLSLYFILVMLK
ncbi:MAG: AEC family transporter [Candidatus Omnitrophica bacterium]|nr:AEC family transporter [Candidatus Omnitrophota bacterium]